MKSVHTEQAVVAAQSAAITEVLAKLEGVTEGSYALDDAIFDWLFNARDWPLGQYYVYEPDGSGSYLFPTVTTSIDDALALIWKLFPDHIVDLTIAGGAQASIVHPDPCALGVQAIGHTAPLALCIALLRALQDKGEE